MNSIRTMNKDLELIGQGKFLPVFSFIEKAETVSITPPPLPQAPALKTSAQGGPAVGWETYTVGPSPLELEMEKLKQKVSALEKEEKIHSAQQEQIKSLEIKVKETLEEKEKAKNEKIALEKRIIDAQEKARQQEIEAQKKALESQKKEEEISKTKQIQLESLENKLKGLANEEKQILTEKIEKTAERVAKIADLKKEILNLEQEKQNILQEDDLRVKALENEKIKIKQEEAKLFEQEIKNLEEAKHQAALASLDIEKQISSLHERVWLLLNQNATLRPDVSSISFNKEVKTPTLHRSADELESALLNTPKPKFISPRANRSFDPYQESLEE